MKYKISILLILTIIYVSISFEVKANNIPLKVHLRAKYFLEEENPEGSYFIYYYLQGMPILTHVVLENVDAAQWRSKYYDELSKGIIPPEDFKKIKIGTKSFIWQKAIYFIVEKIIDANKRELLFKERDWFKSLCSIGKEKVKLLGKLDKGTVYPKYAIGSSWIIDLGIPSKLTPGKYQIKAVYDTTTPELKNEDIYHGKVESKPIIVIVKQAKTKKDKAKLKSTLATYFFHEKNWKKSIIYAQETLKLDPNNNDAFFILAQVYEKTAHFEKAIFYYEQAAKTYVPVGPCDVDYPEFIKSVIIKSLKKRLKEQKAKESKE
jgi:hypothetical protein